MIVINLLKILMNIIIKFLTKKNKIEKKNKENYFENLPIEIQEYIHKINITKIFNEVMNDIKNIKYEIYKQEYYSRREINTKKSQICHYANQDINLKLRKIIKYKDTQLITVNSWNSDMLNLKNKKYYFKTLGIESNILEWGYP